MSLLFRCSMFVGGCMLAIATARADAALPTKDVPGAKDSRALERCEGSLIVGYTDVRKPLSKLEPTDPRDVMNNRLQAPKQQQEFEGALTRLVYLLPSGRSPFEVLRNDQDRIEAGAGAVLFAGRAEGCGGDHARSSFGGGGTSSLMMDFFHDAEVKDPASSNGSCAMTCTLSDQRDLTGKRPDPDGDTGVAVQTFQGDGGASCKQLTGCTVAVVHVLELKARDRKMTTVKADDMAQSIGATGKVAVYGILFDTAKTDVKPESAPTLQEIAALLEANPKLAVIVVGHTDNRGAYDDNLDLSRRRADAVIKAPAASYGVESRRLRAAGVGMVAPNASHDDEAGRSKNRRVELVKLN